MTVFIEPFFVAAVILDNKSYFEMIRYPGPWPQPNSAQRLLQCPLACTAANLYDRNGLVVNGIKRFSLVNTRKVVHAREFDLVYLAQFIPFEFEVEDLVV